MKAFQINDAEIWSGEDLEDAIRAALASYGPGTSREELVDPTACHEISPDARFYHGVDPARMKKKVRVGAILASMAGPGLVWSDDD